MKRLLADPSKRRLFIIGAAAAVVLLFLFLRRKSAAATTAPATAAVDTAAIDPATGLPYTAIDPATGLPYSYSTGLPSALDPYGLSGGGGVAAASPADLTAVTDQLSALSDQVAALASPTSPAPAAAVAAATGDAQAPAPAPSPNTLPPAVAPAGSADAFPVRTHVGVVNSSSAPVSSSRSADPGASSPLRHITMPVIRPAVTPKPLPKTTVRLPVHVGR